MLIFAGELWGFGLGQRGFYSFAGGGCEKITLPHPVFGLISILLQGKVCGIFCIFPLFPHLFCFFPLFYWAYAWLRAAIFWGFVLGAEGFYSGAVVFRTGRNRLSDWVRVVIISGRRRGSGLRESVRAGGGCRRVYQVARWRSGKNRYFPPLFLHLIVVAAKKELAQYLCQGC